MRGTERSEGFDAGSRISSTGRQIFRDAVSRLLAIKDPATIELYLVQLL